MKKICVGLIVSGVKRLNDKYTLLRLTHNEPLPEMCAGQFVEVRVDNSPSTFLRRPISINFFDKANNEIWLLVAAVGDGSRAITKSNISDTLNCVLPLGKGFTMPSVKQKRTLLIGGGAGVAPLLFFGHQLMEQGCKPTFILGARNESELLEIEHFEKLGNVCITTEDGSSGECGFVTNHSVLRQETFDFIATCGPKPMMMAVASYAKRANIECEVSLENMMACGVGACLCCVEKTVKGNICACTEGPVFNINELLWQI